MNTLPWILLGLCVVLLLLALVGWWMASTRVRRHNVARNVVARAGESAADGVLREAGFEVLDRQVTGRWDLRVDGEDHAVSCRADLLVVRDGLRFVAEVKTGERVTDPRHPSTRRQLLEYLVAFPSHGVVLVDMEARRVHHVEFPSMDPPVSN
jgi:hypothetical protein